MQRGARSQTKATNVARVRRNLRLNQNNVEHNLSGTQERRKAKTYDYIYQLALLKETANRNYFLPPCFPKRLTICSRRISPASPRRRQICECPHRSFRMPLHSRLATSGISFRPTRACRSLPISLVRDRVCVRAARSIRKVLSSVRG